MGKSVDDLKPDSTGTLYLVPTPIGNLGDITLRAIEVLRSSDLILAEDTRVTGKLLNLLEVKNELVSMHKFNEHKRLEWVRSLLSEGKQIAYCSDAGTPGISDPGFLIVRECIRHGFKFEVLPGPVAFIPALIASGFATERFVFEGFLPLKKGRHTRLTELKTESRTMIFYESPYRLVKTLRELGTYFGAERNACVSREITKMFEEHQRGQLEDLAGHYSLHIPKGEIVITVEGSNVKPSRNTAGA